MRKFAAAWPDVATAQRVAALLPWGHNILLLDKLTDRAELTWYAEQAAENGWTRKLLEHQVTTGLYAAQGAAITNFAERMPEIEARAAQHGDRLDVNRATGATVPAGMRAELEEIRDVDERLAT